MRPRPRLLWPALALLSLLLPGCALSGPGGHGPRLADRVVLVSLDALGASDRRAIESLPTFSLLMREGSYSFDSRSVWPSLTNVAHASMQTGLPPAGHRVDDNAPFDPESPWAPSQRYGYRSQLGSPTVFDLAGRAGYSTAAVLFPLTGGAAITWNFPEVVSAKGTTDSIMQATLAGSPLFLLDLKTRLGGGLRGTSQPAFDDFVAAAAAWTFRTKAPGLLATHWVEIDQTKHATGIGSGETEAAIAREDARLGRLLEAVRASGMGGRTALLVFGDHSQFQAVRRVRPNAALAEAGLIRKRGSGWSWEAWVQAAGGSAILRARSPAAEAAALGILRRLAADPKLGIDRVMDGAELASLGAAPGIGWALDGKPGTEFLDDPSGPLLEESAAGFGGTHGNSPDWPGYRTVFFALGPGIAKGKELSGLSVMDAAPIVEALLGIRPPASPLPAGSPRGEVPAGLFAASD